MSRPAAAPRRRLAPLLAVTLAASLAGVSSCASSDATRPTADDTTTTALVKKTTTTAATTTQEDVEAEVAARYTEITRRYYERLESPDPGDASIHEDYIEASRDGVVARAGKLQANGQADRAASGGFPIPSVTAVKVSNGTATVNSCLVDDVEVIDSRSGETLNNDVFTQTLETTLKRDGDIWKISEQALLSETPGRSDCPQ